MKSPSFINMQSLERMCRGNLIADIVAVLGSLDILLERSTNDDAPFSLRPAHPLIKVVVMAVYR